MKWGNCVHFHSIRLGIIALFFGATFGAAQAQDSTWKAGVAKAIVTPEKGVWLAGYGSKRPPDGKLHDLWMKALALEEDFVMLWGCDHGVQCRIPSRWM